MKTLMIMVMVLVGAHASVLASEQFNWLKDEAEQKRMSEKPIIMVTTLEQFRARESMKETLNGSVSEGSQREKSVILLQLPNNETLDVQIQEDTRISCLKQIIHDMKNIPFDKQRLCIMDAGVVGQELQDSCRLKPVMNTYESRTFRVEFVTPTT